MPSALNDDHWTRSFLRHFHVPHSTFIHELEHTPFENFQIIVRQELSRCIGGISGCADSC